MPGSSTCLDWLFVFSSFFQLVMYDLGTFNSGFSFFLKYTCTTAMSLRDYSTLEREWSEKRACKNFSFCPCDELSKNDIPSRAVRERELKKGGERKKNIYNTLTIFRPFRAAQNALNKLVYYGIWNFRFLFIF